MSVPKGWDLLKGGKGVPPEPPDDPPECEEPPPEPLEEWETKLQVTAKGEVKRLTSNAIHIVRGYKMVKDRLCYDSRSLTIRWTEAPPWAKKARPFLDTDAGELCVWIADNLHICLEPGMLEYACLVSARGNPYDPVQDYLTGLEWDGVKRLDDWLSTYLGVEPSGYATAVGRAWLISAVARAMSPGCKADHMLVLEGPQGAGKSSALSALVGDDYFVELAIDVADKDSYLAIHGPWVIEWAELVGHNRRESEAVKAFLSRRVDRIRVPYGRVTENYPRSCIFVGTTNDRRYLGDPTGGRRYWPVAVGRIDTEAIERDRDQLWAEALDAYRAGEIWHLEGEAEAMAREEQAARLEQDPWDQLIAYELESGSLSSVAFVTMSDVLSALGVSSASQHSGHARRIARIMAQLGWAVGSNRGQPGFDRPGGLL